MSEDEDTKNDDENDEDDGCKYAAKIGFDTNDELRVFVDDIKAKKVYIESRLIEVKCSKIERKPRKHRTLHDTDNLIM